MAILDDLRAERAKYGRTMTDDECVELCNAVAWKHRADGYGLSGKFSGTRGLRYDGAQVAHDVLHHRPTNTLYDVLRAAGAESEPVWNNVGAPIGDRPWVAPIEPRQSGHTPAPVPTEPAPQPVNLQPILDRLVGLENAVIALMNRTQSPTCIVDVSAIDANVRNLQERVEVAIGLAERAAAAAEHAPTYSGRAGFLGTVTLTPRRD